MLHDFLKTHRLELIERSRRRVASRSVPTATEEELANGIPLFLDQLIDTLQREYSAEPFPAGVMDQSAAQHGQVLLERGFTVGQVVHDYGEVCQAVTELAGDLSITITPEEFHTFNRCLDSAVASAVSEYARHREGSLSELETERLGHLAHEMRNLLSTLTLSFQALRSGTVGLGGSTGRVVQRTLASMDRLVDQSLSEVRLRTGLDRKEHLRVAELIEDVEVSAIAAARGRGQHFRVKDVPYDLFVEGDRQLLVAALTNLIHNAFKFTRPSGTVTLRTHVEGGRVRIDVEDECGGLPAGASEQLFQPYTQRSADRSGLGLGLGIARKSVLLMGGELRVQDLPGKGCVFTVDLPLSLAPMVSPTAHH